ncbi:hypothetical protein EMCG_01945 [[Emmonsia] crescens]|uniref:Uncharacterized protein n=1 Tax=[Emmonsia] crescens TaxID=73230 RepID=A0A0G2J9C8_9EURO|nr:hypothetical protein EMCG_01945 [Emmonsia crescens UAMH 3008]
MVFEEKAEPSTPIPRHMFPVSPLKYPSITRSIRMEEARSNVRIDRAGAEHQNARQI